MKYKLNEYNRAISNQELIEDLKNVSNKNGGKYLSRAIYEKNGQYSATPYIRHFGSWMSALKAAGLSVERTKDDLKHISDVDLLEDIKKVATMLDSEIITARDYTQHGAYSIQTIISRFKSWNNALKNAGLPTKYMVISDTDLFEEIERLWNEKGSQPTTTDIKNGKSIYSLNTYSRHFGGFRRALEAFIQQLENNDNHIIEELHETHEVPINVFTKKAKSTTVKHNTSREVNATLRYKVLKRDNFKCCICGASPAKDPNVELHIDHIIPWSKGGETTIDNLQTLCRKCNLGKKDDL